MVDVDETYANPVPEPSLGEKKKRIRKRRLKEVGNMYFISYVDCSFCCFKWCCICQTSVKVEINPSELYKAGSNLVLWKYACCILET